ncbi:MAG: hypothetical protein RLZZ86_3455 [Cyanobacteriota bacterium]|jgi:hypothetical protein
MALDNNTIIILVVVAALAYFLFVKKQKKEKFFTGNPFQTLIPAVTLYEHGDFQGRAVVLRAGKYNTADLAKFGMPNDTISSIKINPGFMVLAYEHEAFGGRSIPLYSSTNYVGNEWNDKISSLAVVPMKKLLWKNCTPKADNEAGKHHDWCRKDFNSDYAQHVGAVDFRQGGCPVHMKGHGKGVCHVPDNQFIPPPPPPAPKGLGQPVPKKKGICIFGQGDCK